MSPQVHAGTSFPAADPGFAALPVAELLASAEDLVARIRLCFGIDRGSFDSDVQPLLHRFAAYVHLLPATADNYFSTPGGLLRLGLEVAFFSLQGTDAHIFSGRSTISARRQLEPRWRQATFIGGLCCELHRVLIRHDLSPLLDRVARQSYAKCLETRRQRLSNEITVSGMRYEVWG